MKAADLTGTTFSCLTAISRAESDERGRARWICQCVCGVSIVVLAQSLKQGTTRTCGCRTGLAPVASAAEPRYHIMTREGPNQTRETAFGYCEVTDLQTNQLLWRSRPNAYPLGGLRGMGWLAKEGLIQPQNNQTVRQWLISSGVTIMVRAGGDLLGIEAEWEEVTGEQLRAAPPVSFARPVEPAEPPTPELVDLLASFDADDPDDGADHMERYPMSAEARAEMDLQEARRGGQAELLRARLLAKRNP